MIHVQHKGHAAQNLIFHYAHWNKSQHANSEWINLESNRLLHLSVYMNGNVSHTNWHTFVVVECSLPQHWTASCVSTALLLAHINNCLAFRSAQAQSAARFRVQDKLDVGRWWLSFSILHSNQCKAAAQLILLLYLKLARVYVPRMPNCIKNAIKITVYTVRLFFSGQRKHQTHVLWPTVWNVFTF